MKNNLHASSCIKCCAVCVRVRHSIIELTLAVALSNSWRLRDGLAVATVDVQQRRVL